MNGVSLSEYQANEAANNLTVQHAVAASMTGVQASDVMNITVSANGNRRKLTASDSVVLHYR